MQNIQLPPLSPLADPASAFSELNPAPRLLMGPGPINADPRVLKAMSSQLLGQFDPQFRRLMRETMALYRAFFETQNDWTLVLDGTARSAIEMVMVSAIEPGDKVLVASFGRFGQLLTEIAQRCGADVQVVQAEWGTVFDLARIEAALKAFSPKLVAICQGDTSTTMLQPLQGLGELCHRYGAMLQVDATASCGGTPLPVDAWGLDAVTAGLQKCLAGPSGASPITLSDQIAKTIYRRRHIEAGLRPAGYVDGEGARIASNYMDLAMVMDYWSDAGLNHHTEATTMLYGARECARIFVQEGLANAYARHAAASRAVVAGVQGMNLKLVRRHREQDAQRDWRLCARRHQRRQAARCPVERFQHRDRHQLRPVARQGLAHRRDGLQRAARCGAAHARRARSGARGGGPQVHPGGWGGCGLCGVQGLIAGRFR